MSILVRLQNPSVNKFVQIFKLRIYSCIVRICNQCVITVSLHRTMRSNKSIITLRTPISATNTSEETLPSPQLTGTKIR